jgi:Tfp pilus assembly PilM family ATPase
LARFLALDWDRNQLHIIAATITGAKVAVKRAAVWQETDSPGPGEPGSGGSSPEALGQLLRERLRSAGISPAPVLACLGRDRVILKDLHYPAVPESEEAGLVRFQASKELTDSPDDVVIDYMPVGTNGNGEQKALALIARKDIVDAYQKLCQSAHLKLVALTPRAFGVAACIRKVMGTTVLTPPPEPADAAIAVVTVSERWAEFLVLRGETILLSRTLHVGPTLVGEIRRNLAVHAGQTPQHPVGILYLAGAPELRQQLADVLELPLATFDPFTGSETLDLPAANNRGTFAGAAGLLYAKASATEGSSGLPINFVQPRQVKPPSNPNYRLARLAIVAVIALFVGLGILGRILQAGYENELEGLVRARQETENKLLSVRENGKRIKALDEWDNLVWLDELYDLACRITDVNELRITQFHADPLPRSANSRHTAKATLKGELLNRKKGRRPLDDLIVRLGKEGYYSPEAPKVERNTFTLIVHVERRAPGDYKSLLKLPENKGDEVAGDMPARREKGKGKDKGKKGRPGDER